jgi:hypothetical protein
MRVFGSVPPVEDEDPLAPVPTGHSLLSDLRDELAAPSEDKTVLLEVPQRPGYAVRYATVLTHDQLTLWRKRATKSNEVNELFLAQIICGNLCRQIVRQGEPLTDSEERDVTFSSGEFQEAVGATSAVEAVRRFYFLDAHVLATSVQLLREAGYDDEVGSPDPTKAS